MKIDKSTNEQIEVERQKLNEYVELYGTTHPLTQEQSEKLDKLIAKVSQG